MTLQPAPLHRYNKRVIPQGTTRLLQSQILHQAHVPIIADRSIIILTVGG